MRSPQAGDGLTGNDAEKVKVVFRQKVSRAEYLSWPLWRSLDHMRSHDHQVVVKPALRTGGSWLDGCAARRENINLCRERCSRKDVPWMHRAGYRADWNFFGKVSDCDGCGDKLVPVVGFYPEERYTSRMLKGREE